MNLPYLMRYWPVRDLVTKERHTMGAWGITLMFGFCPLHTCVHTPRGCYTYMWKGRLCPLYDVFELYCWLSKSTTSIFWVETGESVWHGSFLFIWITGCLWKSDSMPALSLAVFLRSFSLLGMMECSFCLLADFNREMATFRLAALEVTM